MCVSLRAVSLTLLVSSLTWRVLGRSPHPPPLRWSSLLSSGRQHIPPDMKFDPNANPPCFSNPDDNISIERNARVRLKLLGLRVDATEIFAIGGLCRSRLLLPARCAPWEPC